MKVRRLAMLGTVCMLVVVAAVGVFLSPQVRWWCQWGWGAERPDVLLDSVEIGGRSLQFYVDFGWDDATLGFLDKGPDGRPRYFAIYGTTYRGIDPVVLEVFVSQDNEMWVFSSLEGWEDLAYHRVGSEYVISGFGKHRYSSIPSPEVLRAYPKVKSRMFCKSASP